MEEPFKICSKCLLEKTLDLFIIKDKKTGRLGCCKECNKLYQIKYKEDNYNILSEKWRERCKYKIHNNYDKDNYDKDKAKLINREQYIRHREKRILSNKDNYNLRKNDENFKNKREEYRINNRDKRNLKNRERFNNDFIFRLKTNIRTSINKSLKKENIQKKYKTEFILGCSFDIFKLHLESKFEDWMSWENYGKYNGEINYGWDIDHIIPISSASSEEEVYLLNYYTNLQPLCSKINRHIKINKIK